MIETVVLDVRLKLSHIGGKDTSVTSRNICALREFFTNVGYLDLSKREIGVEIHMA